MWVIAAEIRADSSYTASVARDADAYVQIMTGLTTLSDRFVAEEACALVRYALVGLAHWRGPTARRIKQELRAMVALHEALPTPYRAG